MTIKFSDITGGGIPYGNTAGRPANPGIGKLYSNGETARLELYTQQSGWQNIVQEVPGVASITGSYSEATNSGTIVIAGTNFVSGAIASAIGSNGVETQATSTTYNSLVQLTAVFNNLSNAYEPYDIKVTNPSNLFGLIPDALYINASPVWQTASGSLGTFYEQATITLSAISATDSDSTITYVVANGSSLPSGLTLNSSTGVISGTLPDITTETTYSFIINATDGLNVIPRTFTITSKVIPTSIEYLIVGGGGGAGFGGGASTGGGGAGGMLTGTFTSASSLSNGSTLITVGSGGSGRTTDGAGNSGQNSVALGLTAYGGGGGGTDGNYAALSGGSGGGGGTAHYSPYLTNGGAGTVGQGNSGGNGYSTVQGSPYSSGGGGGAGAAGGAGTTSGGGVGGAGLQSSITGTATYYAGGGGGGSYVTGTVSGGVGGGGASGNGSAGNQPGTSGTPNTGGGAGGARWMTSGSTSASGGSGVVVLAYANTFPALTIPGTLTYDTPTRSGYRVYRFTAGSGTITF